MQNSPKKLDIFDVVSRGRLQLDDASKLQLIKERLPPIGFQFPAKPYKDKRKQGGVMNRYCQREQFEVFPFISYSQMGERFYCLCCVLFPMPSPHGNPLCLFLRPIPTGRMPNMTSKYIQLAATTKMLLPG